MKFLEKNLEDIIYETPNLSLCSRGLNVRGLKRRQVRIGNYGVADVVTAHKEVSEHFMVATEYGRKVDPESKLCITIYELKNDLVTMDAFKQALRYARGIDHYLSDRQFYADYFFEIVLIGKEIEHNGVTLYLPDLLSTAEMHSEKACGMVNRVTNYIYDYNFDGIRFKEKNGFRLTNPGWK